MPTNRCAQWILAMMDPLQRAPMTGKKEQKKKKKKKKKKNKKPS